LSASNETHAKRYSITKQKKTHRMHALVTRLAEISQNLGILIKFDL